MRNRTPVFIPDTCGHCGQTTEYLLGIDRGTVDILKAISAAIQKKGINAIHPRKEMEIARKELDYATMIAEGVLTSNHVGNLSRPRFHGLIAHVKGEKGVYCLTTKGADFLKGKPIPQFAIISKALCCQVGYHLPEEYACTIQDFNHDGEYWVGINYEIREGHVYFPEPARQLTPGATIPLPFTS